MAARLLDDRGQQRRRHPLQRSGDPARRRAHRLDARRLGHLLRRSTPTRSSPPRAAPTAPPVRTRCWSRSSAPIIRWSRPEAGTRSACAAPAAWATCCAPRAWPTRCCRSPTSASTARPWRPTRICSGAPPGRASRPARSRARARFRSPGLARRGGRMPPGGAASHARARHARDAARRGSGGARDLRAPRGRARRTDRDERAARAELPEGRSLRARRRRR